MNLMIQSRMCVYHARVIPGYLQFASAQAYGETASVCVFVWCLFLSAAITPFVTSQFTCSSLPSLTITLSYSAMHRSRIGRHPKKDQVDDVLVEVLYLSPRRLFLAC